MDSSSRGRDYSRREFLIVSLGTAGMALVVSEARAAPACGVDGAVTPPQTEGPYFKPSSPARASLIEPGVSGTKLVIEGSVVTTDCKPVRGARLDFWQADADGHYDNSGNRLRGHQLTDDSGHYRLETIVPARYPGRTRHIHVKVQAPGRPALTTQLYFPGEPGNQRDGIFDPKLVMKVRDVEGGKIGAFDFVLRGG